MTKPKKKSVIALAGEGIGSVDDHGDALQRVADQRQGRGGVKGNEGVGEWEPVEARRSGDDSTDQRRTGARSIQVEKPEQAMIIMSTSTVDPVAQDSRRQK